MIYLQLFWVFLKIGLFGFGGGYAMLSMFQFDVVDNYHWMTSQEFADMVAISQMTPGPISINIATYAGYSVAGFAGALTATVSIVLPSLVLLFFVLKYIFKNKDNKIISTTLSTMRPIIGGLILVASLQMMNGSNFIDFGLHQNNFSVIICAVTFIAIFFFKVNPILMIVASGVAGYLLY
ncbi:MAG: chromate transporter [Candidatus Limimorpha sp.]